MATYNYQAEDDRGNVVSGLIDATDDKSAALAIRDQGLHPVRVRPQMLLENINGAETAARPVETFETHGTATLAPASDNPMFAPVGQQSRVELAPFLNAVPLSDLAIMYRQLATLLGAGVPLGQSLVALAEQTRNSRLNAILREMITMVAAGSPLTKVMERYPSVFSTLQVEMLRAAETSGLMEVMCHRLADYLEREIETKRKIQRETLYPKIVLFVAGCVILLLAFLKSGAEGPIGHLKFAAGVGLTGFGIWWFMKYANQYPQFGAAWDNIRLLIPGTGGIARRYATARFTRALAALYGGGVLITSAVAIAARACGNRAIGQTMLDNVHRLNNGEGISGMLAASGLLSPIAVRMAQTGEQTGSLDAMMDKVADYLESEADTKAHQFAVITGVVALLIAALVVLYIAVTFYTGQFGDAFKAVS
ncbi:MAG: type II secretion system F family protein [Capsulimonadales bacterium]|nr:type II secretion system F family protein [Capsulimonadales bacterium]